jgi:serine/threonine protein kinase
MLNGLREVHAHRLLHLDLKPSNIYMRNSHIPVLIDFGAARQTLACDTPMLKPMYTPGFASPEHYKPARAARPMERHLQCRRLDVCLHLRQYTATGQQPP